MPEGTPAIFAIFSDPQITQYYDLYTYVDMEQAEELIDFFDRWFENKERAIRWGIARKEDNVLIGTCGYVWLRQLPRRDRLRTRQRILAPGHHVEAIQAILEYGFEQIGLNRIRALVMVENAASAGLLRSLGFTEEGVLREHDFFKGRICVSSRCCAKGVRRNAMIDADAV